MSNMTPQDIQRIRDALSTARMSTYDLAVVAGGKSALDLYAWNAEVSGALLGPLHLCEIVIRNAVSDALTTVYQQNWPWNPSFERSLPHQRKNELIAARNRHPNTGKVIPDLTFFFWQNMFSNRHFGRIWDPHIQRIFPNLGVQLPNQQKRIHIHDELDAIRELRNRIAHHEPIFNRNLLMDYQKIVDLVMLRCPVTAQWLIANQTFTTVLGKKP